MTLHKIKIRYDEVPSYGVPVEKDPCRAQGSKNYDGPECCPEDWDWWETERIIYREILNWNTFSSHLLLLLVEGHRGTASHGDWSVDRMPGNCCFSSVSSWQDRLYRETEGRKSTWEFSKFCSSWLSPPGPFSLYVFLLQTEVWGVRWCFSV